MKQMILATMFLSGQALAAPQPQKSDVDARYERASQEMMQAAVDLVRSTTVDPRATKFRLVAISPGGKAVCGEYNARNKLGAYVGFYRFMVTSNMLAHESPGHPFDQQEWVNKCLSDGESDTNK